MTGNRSSCLSGMGRLSVELSDVYFHVISKDADYDPLVAHLKARKIGAAKWIHLGSMPVLPRASAKTRKEQVEATKEWLIERNVNRPKTLKTLANSLKTSAFCGRLGKAEIELLIAGLEERQLLAIQGQKVSYADAFDA